MKLNDFTTEQAFKKIENDWYGDTDLLEFIITNTNDELIRLNHLLTDLNLYFENFHHSEVLTPFFTNDEPEKLIEIHNEAMSRASEFGISSSHDAWGFFTQVLSELEGTSYQVHNLERLYFLLIERIRDKKKKDKMSIENTDYYYELITKDDLKFILWDLDQTQKHHFEFSPFLKSGTKEIYKLIVVEITKIIRGELEYQNQFDEYWRYILKFNPSPLLVEQVIRPKMNAIKDRLENYLGVKTKTEVQPSDDSIIDSDLLNSFIKKYLNNPRVEYEKTDLQKIVPVIHKYRDTKMYSDVIRYIQSKYPEYNDAGVKRNAAGAHYKRLNKVIKSYDTFTGNKRKENTTN